MAGDWIAMRIDLSDDPAVIAMAAELGLDEFGVVGRLHQLWSWANRHLTSGNAASVTQTWVDRYLGTPGFAAAMLNAGWLHIRSTGVEFPHFDRWNTQTAKQRLLTAKRVAAHKGKGNAQGNGEGNGASVSSALPTGQNITEKKKDPPNPPAGGIVPKPSSDAPKPEKAKKPRQQAEPTAEFPIAIRIFTDAWGEKYGTKYPFDGRTDGKIFSSLLERVGGEAERLRPIIARFLADNDDFFAAGARHSPAKLKANFTRWVVDGPTAAPKPTAFKSKRDADAEYFASQLFESMTPTGA